MYIACGLPENSSLEFGSSKAFEFSRGFSIVAGCSSASAPEPFPGREAPLRFDRSVSVRLDISSVNSGQSEAGRTSGGISPCVPIYNGRRPVSQWYLRTKATDLKPLRQHSKARVGSEIRGQLRLTSRQAHDWSPEQGNDRTLCRCGKEAPFGRLRAGATHDCSSSV